MGFADLGSVADLGDEFLLRQQVVGEHPVQFPDLVEQFQFRGGVIAQVADELTDPRPVLLLDVGAVVLVPGTGPGESDPVLEAELEELVVDELTAVIRIDADDGKRKDSQDVLQGREDVFLCLVRHGPVHRPAGRNIRDR